MLNQIRNISLFLDTKDSVSCSAFVTDHMTNAGICWDVMVQAAHMVDGFILYVSVSPSQRHEKLPTLSPNGFVQAVWSLQPNNNFFLFRLSYYLTLSRF